MKQNGPRNYVIATTKPWNINAFQKEYGGKKNFYLISEKEDLTLGRLRKINPRFIFFPHWSWVIPEEIWSQYECVTIHETDLPYGRGGSPIQNLIKRGHTRTKISAIRINAGLDTGDVYLKRSVSLTGSAQDIFDRISTIVFSDIIPSIVKSQPVPKPQRGKATLFKRRTPEESDLSHESALSGAYDTIRMLDADTYPKAYLATKNLVFTFSNALLNKKKGKITARVEIHGK